MEKKFKVLRMLIPRHSPMLKCLLETNSSQPLMPATEIYFGRTFMLTTALILGLKYRGTKRLEQLTVWVHSSVSVLIWSFTHFTKMSGPVCWLSCILVIIALMETEFLPFSLIIRVRVTVGTARSWYQILWIIRKIIFTSKLSSITGTISLLNKIQSMER